MSPLERAYANCGGAALVLLRSDWLWPREVRVDWFTAFIAADARRVSDTAIRSLATEMLAQRCASVAAWGPDCVRVHHGFDDAYVTWPAHSTFRRWGRWQRRWSDEIPFLMTTDHHDESLSSALWYAAWAWPSGDGYVEHRPAAFVALVEQPFRDEVRSLLLDPDRLNLEAEADEE